MALPATLIALCSIAVPLRTYVRGYMLKSFGLDDWLLVVAYVIFVIDCACSITLGYVEANKGVIQNLDLVTNVGHLPQ